MPCSTARFIAGLLSTTCWKFSDRKSTRLNSSHTVIYTLSLHDALPILADHPQQLFVHQRLADAMQHRTIHRRVAVHDMLEVFRSEEHTSELQSHSDLHSFPTRRSSDLSGSSAAALCASTARRCHAAPHDSSPGCCPRHAGSF